LYEPINQLYYSQGKIRCECEDESSLISKEMGEKDLFVPTEYEKEKVDKLIGQKKIQSINSLAD